MTSAQTVITPSAATATTWLSAGFVIGNTIDGSGLTAVGDVSTWTHVLTVGGVSYLCEAGQISATVLTFTLPSASTVVSLYLWQYDRNNVSWNDRGLNTFDLSF